MITEKPMPADWMTNYAEGLKKAAADRKYLIVDLTADW